MALHSKFRLAMPPSFGGNKMKKYTVDILYNTGQQDIEVAVYSDAQAEIERLKAEIVRMKKHTWCAYCGHEILIDDEAATKISKYITEDCPKHPIRIALAEIAALREKLREREKEKQVLEDMMNDQGEQHCSNFQSCVVSRLPEDIRVMMEHRKVLAGKEEHGQE